MAFGSILGSFGTLWTLSGAFGCLIWPLKPNFYEALVQHGLQKTFWIDFGLILAGFGEDLDASW